MTPVKISFDVVPSDSSVPLGLEVWIDSTCVVDADHVSEIMKISHDVDDNVEGDHELRIVLKNKLAEHTQIDSNGTITADAVLTISDIMFDGINIEQIAIDNATYTHDFNGSQELTQAQFFGPIGCNGVVSLKFTTPVYLWLLENM